MTTGSFMQVITFAVPQQMRRVSTSISHKASTVGENPLQLLGLFLASGERRIVLPVRLLRSELPERPDFFKQASRYLG